MGGVEDEHRVTRAARLSSKLLGAVRGRIPAVHSRHKEICFLEEVTNLQEHGPGLLTLAVPGGVEHEQGVFELTGVREGCVNVAMIVVLHESVSVLQERPRSWRGSNLRLIRVSDNTKNGANDENDEHDVTKQLPAQFQQDLSCDLSESHICNRKPQSILSYAVLCNISISFFSD